MKLLKTPPFVVLGTSPVPFNQRQWAIVTLALVVLVFLFTPWPLYDKLWGIAYGICPQRPGHSLFFGDVQMPIEAREGGIFAGFLLGISYLIVLGRGKAWKLPPLKIQAVLVGFIILMGLDGVNAFAFDLNLPTPYDPNLVMRSGTGLLAGIALAGLLLPIFNQTIWKQPNQVVSFSKWRELAPALLLLAIFGVAGLSGWGPLLYPISISAIFGQVILMVSLGTMMAAILLRREGQVSNLTELAPLILVGLVAVILLMSATSAVRYSLFGPGSIPEFR